MAEEDDERVVARERVPFVELADERTLVSFAEQCVINGNDSVERVRRDSIVITKISQLPLG